MTAIEKVKQLVEKWRASEWTDNEIYSKEPLDIICANNLFALIPKLERERQEREAEATAMRDSLAHIHEEAMEAMRTETAPAIEQIEAWARIYLSGTAGRELLEHVKRLEEALSDCVLFVTSIHNWVHVYKREIPQDFSHTGSLMAKAEVALRKEEG